MIKKRNLFWENQMFDREYLLIKLLQFDDKIYENIVSYFHFRHDLFTMACDDICFNFNIFLGTKIAHEERIDKLFLRNSTSVAIPRLYNG